MKKLIILCLLFIFSASVNAASITIKNVETQKLINAIKKEYVKKGAIIEQANDYSLTIKEPKPSFFISLVYGNIFLKTVYNFAQDDKDTIVNTNFFIVENDGNALSRTTPLPETDAQLVLNQIKRKIDGYYTYGFDYEKNIKTLTVLSISNDDIDLVTNDKIRKINNIPIIDLTLKQVEKLIFPDEPKEITLEVKSKVNGLRTITLNAYYVKPLVEKSVSAKFKK